ncbi:MAG: DUF3883 domain-containing protein [bacterium]
MKDIKIEYKLNDISVSASKDIAIHNGNLYIKENTQVDADHLSVELSRLFGNIRGLDDFLILLFSKKTTEKIEHLLKLKGIQDLPDDEKEYLQLEPSSEEAEDKEPHEEEEIPKETQNEATWNPVPPEEAKPIITPFQPKEKEKEGHKKGKKENEAVDQETNEEKQPPQPTIKEKKAIGRWGEEHVFLELKKKFKAKYPEGQIEESDGLFIIRKNGTAIVKVEWLNYAEDKEQGYDIYVDENGNEEFIEVKATKTESKDWFDVTRNEWQKIKEKGESFHIYRVYKAGERETRIEDIQNPWEKWANNELEAYPIKIHI